MEMNKPAFREVERVALGKGADLDQALAWVGEIPAKGLMGNVKNMITGK